MKYLRRLFGPDRPFPERIAGARSADRNSNGNVAQVESIMSYAVFKDGDRISRPFQTEGDAWECANDAGLVENVPSGGGGSVQLLDSHCIIKSCDTGFVMHANLA